MRWVLSSLAVVAAGVVGMATPERDAPGRAALNAAPQAAPESSRLPASLPARKILARARIDPFAPRDWTPRPPPAPVQAAPAPPLGPTVPPNPYRFAGTAHYAGSLKAVFVRDDRIHVVQPGETLDAGYKLLSVRRDAVTLLYTPLGIEQRIALAPEAASIPVAALASASIPAAAPALGAQPAGAAASPFPPGSPLVAR